VISLLVMATLLVVGAGTLTTSRIETQMARYDLNVRHASLAAEYALALGESTVEQALNEQDLAAKLTHFSGRLYDKKQQPAWNKCFWDDRDSIDVSHYFQHPTTQLSTTLPPLPPPLRDAHDRPRLMVERKYSADDSLSAPKTYGNKAGVTYVHVSAHGARARWTALGNGQPDDRPGLTSPSPPTYNERYPGTRVVLQSMYAKRYK
jgi:hypothetical protein